MRKNKGIQVSFLISRSLVMGYYTTDIINNTIDTPQRHHHPVGLDLLFTVSLPSLILYPAFWTGTPVRVLLSHWFYAPPTTPSSNSSSHSIPSHELKPYPVDPELAQGLDRAFAQIRPWEESYPQELAAALKGGVEAQKRLCLSLGVGNESGVDASKGAGIEVVFEGSLEGRVYSKGFLGSVGKGWWRGGNKLGGGQVVLRGEFFSASAPRGRS